jgi:lysophospholipase L1-like esterase
MRRVGDPSSADVPALGTEVRVPYGTEARAVGWRRVACLVGLVVLIGGCGGSSSQASGSGAATGTAASNRPPPSLLILGDSIVETQDTPCQCPAGVATFAHRIGARLTDQSNPGSTARDLLDQVKTDSFVRQLIRKANDIVVSMGLNDLPWNRPDLCAVGNPPTVRWAGVTQRCIRRVAGAFERTMNATLTEIDALRRGKPTTLRWLDAYNTVIGDHVDASYGSPAAVKASEAAVTRFDAIQCRLAGAHGGRCVDIERTFNGPRGSHSARRYLTADYTHPNADGQQLIASDLLAAR